MQERRDQIVDMYFQTNSVSFGEHLLSAHRVNSGLAPSPYYLHYPKPNQPGYELLPQLYELIGEEFYELCATQDPPLNPKRIAGLPNGGTPLGEALAKQFSGGYPDNFLIFDKHVEPGQPPTFDGPIGNYSHKDELLLVEDHTSAGVNKKLFLPVARWAGLVVKDIVTVVDREQGGTEALAAADVRLLSIFTITSFMESALRQNLVTESDAEKVYRYQESADSRLY